MIRNLVKKLGIVKSSLAVTAVSILSSVLLFLVLSIIFGRPSFVGIVNSITIPAIITPLLSFFFLRVLLQLDRAQEDLRESEEKYRTLVEQSLQGIVVIQDNRIVFTNEAFADVSGYTVQEMLSLSLEKVMAMVHPHDQELVWGRLRDRLEGKSVPRRYEYRGIRKDGSERWLEMFANLIRYDGRAAVQGVIMDVSERKRTEEALKHEKKRLESLIEHSSLAVVTLDEQHNILSCNSDFEKLFLFEESEIQGKNLDDVLAGQEFMEDALAYTEKTTKGKPIHGTGKRYRANGTLIDVQFFGVPVIVDRRVMGAYGIYQDIGMRKQAEEALQREKERFRVLVEESPFGVSLISKDGHYKYINRKFTETFGYTLEDIPAGRDWFKKAYPDSEYRHLIISLWKEDFQESKIGESRPRTFHVTCKDGSEKVIHFRTVTMENGEHLVMYEDITEQRRMEVQLRQAQKMEAIGTLAGGIAHDFNNILSSILGYSELANLDVPDGSKAHKALKEVLRAGNRAKDLVKQILAFSRQTEEERKPIQVGPIVKETLKLLRASLPTTIEIRQSIETDTDIVEVDPTQIHQVLMNLCTNAAHAIGDKDGVLEVSLARANLDPDEVAHYPDLDAGSFLKLTVNDTGQGMKQDVLERIFDPYFTTKEKGVGTGLGLAVVHGIVKSHGGAITVQSEVGKGSAFGVYLPLVDGKVIQETDIKRKLPRGHECILFIDDDQVLADVVKQMLEYLGYEVVTRTSTIEALELFRTKPNRFDLVITDMTMPMMRGEKLAREVMKIRSDIPVILCSGFSERISKKKAREMGIKEFVMKPIVMQDLANTVRMVLDEK